MPTIEALEHRVRSLRAASAHNRILAHKALAVAVIALGMAAKQSVLVEIGLFALGVKVRYGKAFDDATAAEVFEAVKVDLEERHG